MDYNKSIIFNPTKSTNKILLRNLSFRSKNNNDKRKSDDICNNHFINNINDMQKNKIIKIPIKNRLSLENKNAQISIKENILKSDNSITKDQNYYRNLLNNIYNDSHLSNKNLFSSQNSKKKFEKKKTFNLSGHRNSKDNSQKKSINKNSIKKLSYCSNDIKNNNISINNACINSLKIKSNKAQKKLSNFSNEINGKAKKYINEKNMPKYQSSRIISKFKKNISNNDKNKMKSTNNMRINNENDLMNDTIKEQKKANELKILVNKNDKKRKSSIQKDEVELEKCDTKINSNKNIAKNDLNNNNILKNINSKNKKKNRFCFFCCLTSKDDSLSDINE